MTRSLTVYIVLQKHPVDFCKSIAEARVELARIHASMQRAFMVRAQLAQDTERKRERSKRSEKKRACMHAYSRARTHADARRLRKPACEKRPIASRSGSRWGHPRGPRTANRCSIAGVSRVGFPLVCVRVQERKRERDKKTGECTHKRRIRKRRRERERMRGLAKKRGRETSLHRVSLDSSPLPRILGGKGVKEGHDVPNERAP